MNYNGISKCDMANGIGVRVVLWVSGCSHHCKGCHNPHTWDENSGKLFDKVAKKEIFDELSKPYISGLTLSGGDPLFEANRKDIANLILEIKQRFIDKTIWLYTGYLWEEVQDLDFIKYLDVLVDGEFVQDKRDISLKWVGSSNQRVIDVHKTLLTNKIITI